MTPLTIDEIEAELVRRIDVLRKHSHTTARLDALEALLYWIAQQRKERG